MRSAQAVSYHDRDDGTLPFALAKARRRCQWCDEDDGDVAVVVAARLRDQSAWFLAMMCWWHLGQLRQDPGVVVLAPVTEPAEPELRDDADPTRFLECGCVDTRFSYQLSTDSPWCDAHRCTATARTTGRRCCNRATTAGTCRVHEEAA